MHARFALLVILLVACSRNAEPRKPRPACTGGTWHVQLDDETDAGGIDVVIDPAHPRLALGPDRDHEVTVIGFDPATCRIDVLVLTEHRYGAEGYEDADHTMRLSFTEGPGARTVTGEYERQVFDPRSYSKTPFEAVARRIEGPSRPGTSVIRRRERE